MSTNVVHSLAPAAVAVGEVHAPEEAAPPAQPQGVGVEHGALAHINEQMARLQDAADMLNVQALANKKENRKVFYTAPCGRRIRSLEEVHGHYYYGGHYY